MDLSTAETFIYLLMVVALFTSPITVGLLAFGFFKGAFLRALGGIVIALPVITVAVQLTIYLQDRAESREYQREEARLEKVFAPTLRGKLIDGYLVGYKEVYDLDYARYQFEIPGFSPKRLTILVPPTNITSGATISLTDPEPPLEVAQLVILSPDMTAGSAGRAPARFFAEEYPVLAADLITDRILMLHLSARQSQITYYSGEDDKYPWRSQSAFLQLDNQSNN